MARKTITSLLQHMQLEEQQDFPAEMCFTVRSMASNLSFKWNRKYTTTTDRERRVITVTRVK